jgi:ribosomal protein S18 acetylase RimI-like enzyme
MEKYLENTDIIDWQAPNILELADQISIQYHTPDAIAKACFEWVRDEIHHSFDYQMNPITCRASDVLKYRTGYCFAKSHLLAALLRANQIPAGFCYQRLSLNDLGAPYSLHGFNAILLPTTGWYRVDARGNHQNIDAQFQPPQEQLAFEIKLPQEVDFSNIFHEPLPIVVEVLERCNTWEEVISNLPDISLEMWQQYQLSTKVMNYQIRALASDDESGLWTMLMYAAHESSLEIVRQNAELARYVKDWGRIGDCGFVACEGEEYIGAAWLRLFTAEEHGYGYIQDDIPELAFAVSPAYRGQGIGTKLLIQVIESAANIYPAISLSVRSNNPILNLYQRLGFVKVAGTEVVNRTEETSFNMIYQFERVKGI